MYGIQLMKKLTLLLVLTGVVTAAMAEQSSAIKDQAAIVKDTRVFSCGDTEASIRKCVAGETPWAVKGELTVRFSDNECERHTYSVGGGDVYQSEDGRSQIQFPAQIDRVMNFRCDAQGNAF